MPYISHGRRKHLFLLLSIPMWATYISSPGTRLSFYLSHIYSFLFLIFSNLSCVSFCFPPPGPVTPGPCYGFFSLSRVLFLGLECTECQYLLSPELFPIASFNTAAPPLLHTLLEPPAPSSSTSPLVVPAPLLRSIPYSRPHLFSFVAHPSRYRYPRSLPSAPLPPLLPPPRAPLTFALIHHLSLCFCTALPSV